MAPSQAASRLGPRTLRFAAGIFDFHGRDGWGVMPAGATVGVSPNASGAREPGAAAHSGCGLRLGYFLATSFNHWSQRGSIIASRVRANHRSA